MRQQQKNNDQKIYASMARMSDNNKCHSKDFGDISQLKNWNLDSGVTCNMTIEVSVFIPGPLDDTDKHIEVSDEHHVMTKKRASANKNVQQ